MSRAKVRCFCRVVSQIPLQRLVANLVRCCPFSEVASTLSSSGVQLHSHDLHHNFCSACAVTVVIFGHLNRSFLLTYLLVGRVAHKLATTWQLPRLREVKLRGNVCNGFGAQGRQEGRVQWVRISWSKLVLWLRCSRPTAASELTSCRVVLGDTLVRH